MSNIKQVILFRKDLKMRTGKVAAQVAHASMKVFFDRKIVFQGPEGQVLPISGLQFRAPVGPNTGSLRSDEDMVVSGIPSMTISLTPEMQEWVEGRFTKIVLSVADEETLLRAHALALEAGLPCALIQDMGATEFKAECSSCEGTGEVLPVLAAQADGFPPTDCEPCQGTGRVGVPTYTAAAIGPAKASEINAITGPVGAVATKLA